MPGELNPKQQRFVDVFDGNATAAARLAGYEGSDASLAVTASRLLKRADVKAALALRNAKEVRGAAAKVVAGAIASRQARQEFWTKVMEDTGAEMKDRLKASELLGKSEADFTDKLADADGKPISFKFVINRSGK